MGRLDGKVALISGGARGQGALEAELFVSEGAKVVFGDVLDPEGEAVEAKIKNVGGDATYVHLDVTRDDEWRRAVDLAESTYGKLDVLINNAGIAHGEPILETTDETWDRVMAINGKGVFLGTRAAIPAMQRAGGGSIINISSIAALIGQRHTGSAYAASKGMVRIFSKTTAIQYADDGIRCNSIHPGPTVTAMTAAITDNPEVMERRLREIPLRRLGRVEDVAFGALYLASDESSYITGIELIIDGGLTAQ